MNEHGKASTTCIVQVRRTSYIAALKMSTRQSGHEAADSVQYRANRIKIRV